MGGCLTRCLGGAPAPELDPDPPRFAAAPACAQKHVDANGHHETGVPGKLAHENLAYSTGNSAGHSCSARAAPSNPFDLECGISADPGGGGGGGAAAAAGVLYDNSAHVSRRVEGEEATCGTMDVSGISEGSVKADVVISHSSVMPQDWTHNATGSPPCPGHLEKPPHPAASGPPPG